MTRILNTMHSIVSNLMNFTYLYFLLNNSLYDKESDYQTLWLVVRMKNSPVTG